MDGEDGSLCGILGLCVNHLESGSTFPVLMITYRKFCSPQDMLSLVFDRMCEAFNNQTFPFPKVMVLIVFLRRWYRDVFSDFVNPIMITQLGHLRSVLEEAEPKFARHLQFEQWRIPVPPTMMHQVDPISYDISLQDISASDLIQELTIWQQHLYQQIPIPEFVGCHWLIDASKCPHISEVFFLSKRIKLWVTKTILDESNVNILSYFLDCIKESMRLNNWECVYQMYLGFSHPEVKALIQTHFKEIDSSRRQAWTDVTSLFQVENSPFGRYRRVSHNFNPPVLPILGSHLEDLEFVNLSQPDYKENGFINLKKCRVEAGVIEEIRSLQSIHHDLNTMPHIRAWLQNHM
eukprot:TRINITY_DN10478_c0_g1_i1.p1 TRINITY_DN10478_c0_g1~~TRINITY_DN10478_c0_g1_i1.p1  ORF type:complete len:356 (-),score=64.39 TRINITY_DN10478_c0_g1_i1:267-1313(-)